MHKPLTFAVILLVAVAAWAAAMRSGKITALDDAAKSFTCHREAGDTTYKTNDKTTFWVGTEVGTWTDLKKGVVVTITAHDEGGVKVADKVMVHVHLDAPMKLPPVDSIWK